MSDAQQQPGTVGTGDGNTSGSGPQTAQGATAVPTGSPNPSPVAQPVVYNSDAVYIKSLQVIGKFSWSGLLVFGAVAGFLLNTLASNTVSAGLKGVIVDAIAANMMMVILLLCISTAAFFAVTAQGLQAEKKKLRANVSAITGAIISVVGILALMGTTYYAKEIWYGLANI